MPNWLMVTSSCWALASVLVLNQCSTLPFQDFLICGVTRVKLLATHHVLTRTRALHQAQAFTVAHVWYACNGVINAWRSA
jgi:hypothetical protein